MKGIFKALLYIIPAILLSVFGIILLFIIIKEPNMYIITIIFSFYLSLVILATSYLPLISSRAGKLQEVNTGTLFNIVSDVFSSTDISISKAKIYVRPRRKKPVANATVQGYSNYTIIFNQDLLDELEDSELKAVIYHEIFHIKEKHDLYGTIIMILLVLFPSIVITAPYKIELPKELQLVFFIILTFVYIIGYILLLLLSRKKELAADLFAVDKMGKSEPLINALIKMSKKNKEKENLSFARQLFATHYPLGKRIALIKETYKNK
ncbi:M48 family metallopeptidase [Acetivibrio clariflavus]|uniref:M48 family metallopeptidase n=1 Tax=Acetivibrio clariflavus TaxID=288965 RepID=UPI0031F4E447